MSLSVRGQSDQSIKRQSFEIMGPDSDKRETIIVPHDGKKLRLREARLYGGEAENSNSAELYFGTGDTLAADPSKAVADAKASGQGWGDTRGLADGVSKDGGPGEVLSIRQTQVTAKTYAIIEWEEV
jgi:hypothetical protein